MARRGSYAKGIAKREEILTVALDLVAQQGFRRTSIKDIADAVGLTQAGLLHYFDSKDELWVEILRRRDEIDLAHDWHAEDPAALLAAIVRHNTEVPGLVQMFVNLSAAAATDAIVNGFRVAAPVPVAAPAAALTPPVAPAAPAGPAAVPVSLAVTGLPG